MSHFLSNFFPCDDKDCDFSVNDYNNDNEDGGDENYDNDVDLDVTTTCSAPKVSSSSLPSSFLTMLTIVQPWDLEATKTGLVLSVPDLPYANSTMRQNSPIYTSLLYMAVS